MLFRSTDLNPLEAMLCYKQLWTVEQTFRTAKHLLTTRPICRTAGRTDSSALPSLSPVTPSAASERFPEVRGSSPISWSFAASCVVLNQGPFPPPALPGFIGRTGPSATLSGPACPSRASGWLVTPQPPLRASRVASISLCMRAAANTPVEPPGARFAHFPSDDSLPRFYVGSASTSPFSGPAQRSLHVAARMLAESPK